MTINHDRNYERPRIVQTYEVAKILSQVSGQTSPPTGTVSLTIT